jgi:hypothetical protein
VLEALGESLREFDHRIAEREDDDDTILLRQPSIERIHSACTVHADAACATGL